MINSIYDTLVELGVDRAKLKKLGNDILYEDKKFVGFEQKTANGVFSQDIILTLKYKPEEKVFKRLSGKYALARGIIGIQEEANCFTREQFIEKLKEKVLTFINTLE
jgi:lipoate-protein ligase A